MVLDPKQREFVRLLAVTERRLNGYVLSLVPNLADADEILQETHIRLWEEYEKFEPGTNFAAWALRVAHFEVLTWRKRARRRNMVLDDELVEELSVQLQSAGDMVDARQGALSECLAELSDRSRGLLHRVYADGEKIKDIASSLEKTAESVYKTIQRLRLALRKCIEQRLAEEQPT